MFSIVRRRRAGSPLALLLVGWLAGCEGPPRQEPTPAVSADSAVSAVDVSGRTVRLPRPAQRIVSLVPSGTETLFALGAGEQVVGRTQYDTDPAFAHLPSVGGGLDPSVEALVALQPDLVVAWDAQKSPGLHQRLTEMGVPVFSLRTQDTTDVFETVEQLGRLVGRPASADSLAASLRKDLAEVRASVQGRPRPSVLYVVWNDPPMTAGPNTFIAQIIEIAGGRTVFPDLQQDWPQVSMEEIVRRQPEVVVLPVGENRAHSAQQLSGAPGWRQLRAVREGRMVEVPTDLMNRPGPNLGKAARVMRAALHPAPGPSR